MQITVRASSGGLSRLARRRLEFALGPFHGRVRSVAIRIADLNGPHGGIDKQCRVTVQLSAMRRKLVVEGTDADAAMAIDRAAVRTARTVARAIDTETAWRPGWPASMRPSAFP